MSIGAIMETMALNTFANTYPADLSGGQCQRVISPGSGTFASNIASG